jgi:hypothetical protein
MVSALSAEAYTTTSLRDGSFSEGSGRALPPTQGWADFSIMMVCTPESGHCHSVCTLRTRCLQFAAFFQ